MEEHGTPSCPGRTVGTASRLGEGGRPACALPARRRGPWAVPLLLGLLLAGCLGERGEDEPPEPAPRDRDAACGDPFPDAGTSPYVLPYPPGTTRLVGQGTCTDGSHAAGSPDAFAYDFDMPIGSVVVAARGGVVTAVEERFVDGNRVPGEENVVVVRHDDGTVAEYVHLTLHGALVEVGQRVHQGQDLARSGDTGDSTEPHLHFQVSRCAGCGSLPVTFRNTRAHPGGLVEGEAYAAH